MPYKLVGNPPESPELTNKLVEQHKQSKLSYTQNVLLAVFMYILYIHVIANQNIFRVARRPVTKHHDLIDATSYYFDTSTATETSPSTVKYHVSSRPDIQSFAFDLGGTSCACQLQWLERPTDMYYNSNQWCGLSRGVDKTRSCPLIEKS